MVDGYFRVKGLTDVFAIGDCASCGEDNKLMYSIKKHASLAANVIIATEKAYMTGKGGSPKLPKVLFLSLSLFLTLSNTHTHTHSLSLSYTHTLSLSPKEHKTITDVVYSSKLTLFPLTESHTHSLTLPLSLTHTFSLSLSYTHTYTHSLISTL